MVARRVWERPDCALEKRGIRPFPQSANHHGWGTLLAVLAAALAPPASAAEPQPPSFHPYELRVEDRVSSVLAADLDADGRRDFLVVHVAGLPPSERRMVSVFLQRGDGAFPATADQAWEIDPRAAVLDVGDVAGDASLEIVMLGAEGVRYHRRGAAGYETEPRTLFEERTLTAVPDERDAPVFDFVRDWNGDGRDDVLTLTLEGVTLRRREGAGFAPPDRLALELRGSAAAFGREIDSDPALVGGVRVAVETPVLRLADYDADGRRDLCATIGDRLLVHRLGEDGRFGERPVADVSFDLLTGEEKREAWSSLSTVVHDLDGDGYADVVASKETGRGLMSFRSAHHVYFGRPGGFRAGEPDDAREVEGAGTEGPLIRDLDGDGRADLVLPGVKLGIAALVRALLFHSVDVKFHVYRLGADRRFPERPDYSEEVKFEVDLSGSGKEQDMTLGDFDGDGRADYVFAAEEDRLVIHTGIADAPGRLFSKKPAATVATEAFGSLEATDLDRDGRDEIFIRYGATHALRGRVTVLMNRR